MSSEPRYFKGKYFEWKIEGPVVTIYRRLGTVPTLEEFFSGSWIMDNVKAWKQQGIKVIEFQVPPECFEYVSNFFKTNKITFKKTQELTINGRTLIRCQLLL